MNFAERMRAAVWRVPVGVQFSAVYTLLLVAILALLGWGLYASLTASWCGTRRRGWSRPPGW